VGLKQEAVNSGSGSGSGYGYGYGSGSGSGYGYGYGYGSGYGSGSGSGYGYGSGSGYKLIAEALAGPGALWWRSDADGRPCNNGSGDPVQVGMVQEWDGPVKICKTGFHATTEPERWRGPRWWIVRLEGDLQTDGEKTVGRKRTIVAEFGAKS
jgi:hypothetical protein